MNFITHTLNNQQVGFLQNAQVLQLPNLLTAFWTYQYVFFLHPLTLWLKKSGSQDEHPSVDIFRVVCF